MSESPDAPKRSRWSSPRTWVVAGLIVLVVWFLGSALLAGFHAWRANAALNAMTDQIAAGDPQAAAASISSARSNASELQDSINSAPLALLTVVPYFKTNFAGADTFMDAAGSVLDAADVTNTLYASLSGADGGTDAAFANGTINIGALERIQPQVQQISAYLQQAQQTLGQLPPRVSPQLRDAAAKAEAKIAGIQTGLNIYEEIRPDLPTLLGRGKPARYLVVFHNPGEMFPGGGAALNVALVQFDDGKLDVVEKGAVSTDFFPGNPRVSWDPVAGGPYYETSNAKDGFAWSNLHQDYRITGEDIMRSWVANGEPPVDGVISLDPAAMSAAVAATGPIETPLYGQITADNLVSKLFYEEYNEDPAAQARRHQVNQQLIDEMLARMQNGNTALTIGRAMFATAPGHHVRIHLSDNRLQDALAQAQADGAQPAAEPDRVAFFTQNQNASKVDIFQNRSVMHSVQLAADGSATVTQAATVTNNAPDNGTAESDRIGYTTRWAFHWNVVFLPQKAQDVQIRANDGEIKADDRVFTDVDGRKAVRIGRWIPPGQSSVITATYRLPAGTFGRDGNLEYRTSVEHQLVVNGVDMTIEVAGPSEPAPLEGEWTVDGNRATAQFVVTRPTTLALGFGDRA